MQIIKSPQLILTFLLVATLYLEASLLRKSMFLRSANKTWAEARRDCRQVWIDLLPTRGAHSHTLSWMLERNVSKVWVGAYRDPNNPSAWKKVNLRRGEEIWEPANPDDKDCAFLDVDAEAIKSSACSTELPYVCLGDNLELVKENKTWEEALQHCQDMNTQCDKEGVCKYSISLLTLHTLAVYGYVRDRIATVDTDEVWTGLRFLGGRWFWLDGEEVQDKGKLPHCPSQLKHCGTLSKYDTEEWISRDCTEKRNFICVKKCNPVRRR